MVQQDMNVAGVNLVCADQKPGSVDDKLKRLMSEANRHWRQQTQAEKDGALVVVISGDSDFAHEVRQLRKDTDVDGVRVCIVFSKNAPAKTAYQGNADYTLDEWADMVEKSRKGVLPEIEPAAEENVISGIKKPQMRFLHTVPAGLRDLNLKLQEAHPSISARLAAQQGSLQEGKDGLAAARRLTEHFLQDIQLSDPAHVSGLSSEQVAGDSTLKTLASLHGLSVFILGVKPKVPSQTSQASQALQLRDHQLFVKSDLTESDIMARCWDKWQVAVYRIFWLGGCMLDNHHFDCAAANAAKQKLLKWCSGPIQFSLRPFNEEEAMIQMWMKHPKDWTSEDLHAFRDLPI